jgi:adenine deaminase
MKVSGKLVDIHKRSIYPALINILNGRINHIEKIPSAPDVYIMPGLIDSHIHIESSMITPGAFAMTAVKHGTVGTVSDPHEIANVLGAEGIKYMIEDAGKVPMKFWFGASSCVPATDFETSGASLTAVEIETLLKMPEIKYLGEMMNFPGVINGDKEILKKLGIARKAGKPVDGHAPGLSGEMLQKYIEAGISTDHECSTLQEAMEKISLGMKILIREGSAARNLNALKNLFDTNPEDVMLCSDDLHPEMLQQGHINKLVARLISDGYNLFDVVRSATLNPSKHYNLQAGLLNIGDSADFILVENLEKMKVLETWIRGEKVYGDGNVLFTYNSGISLNNFNCSRISKEALIVDNKRGNFRVIEAFDGELFTKELIFPSDDNDIIFPDREKDILKIVVKDRYNDNYPVTAFIKGFGLKKGAFASSVAHDSHNIISVGTNDEDITSAINEIVRMKGGLSVSSNSEVSSLQLDIAGIMTTRSCDEVAKEYLRLNDLVKTLGCTMNAPFMTLSFMALLVIPELKIGDKGLFDLNKFRLVPLFVE